MASAKKGGKGEARKIAEAIGDDRVEHENARRHGHIRHHVAPRRGITWRESRTK